MSDLLTFPLPSRNDELLSFLSARRSNLAKNMTGPGPSPDEIKDILEIAARVPDHRKLNPWRFIIFEGESRQRMGKLLGKVFEKENPDLPQDRVGFEAQRFMRAPLVVAVVSSPIDCPRGTPEWEQRLSSAAVCFNMCLAAQAHGYGAQWLTEWYAYHSQVLNELGLSESEKISGFIYIGTPGAPSTARPRPVLEGLITSF